MSHAADATAAGAGDRRPVVAHVNYLYFHSTESFIAFSMTHARRVRPICLTRAPDTGVAGPVPGGMEPDFYVYPGRTGGSRTSELVWSAGLATRRIAARLPPRVADRLLDGLHRHVVPRARSDADPDRYLAWARGILERRDARVIHAYFGPVGWRLLALKRSLGLPLVVTFLGDELAPTVPPWWWWWIRTGVADGPPDWPARLAELFAGGDLFLVEGPYMRDRLVELGCPPGKVEVQRIAIPVESIAYRAPPRDRGGDVIVFAGRFCEQKGILDALAAVRQLRDEGRDVELRLIGDETLTDGRYAARVYAYVREHRLQDCVRLLGFLDHAACLAAMAAGDVFLHPSVVAADGASEGGAPTTILEAQALGLPVVSTVHCDIPNVTVPGETALLVPERDASALAGALRVLLDDPVRREAMGRAGRAHVERYHDARIEAETLDGRYLALLAR